MQQFGLTILMILELYFFVYLFAVINKANPIIKQ